MIMRQRSNVSPVPLSVERSSDAVRLHYLDGRVVTYHGPFEYRKDDLVANRSFEVHVLVVDRTTGEGIMTYINDYNTSDAILESTGVGRVILDDGQREIIYPGVSASLSGEQIHVSAETVGEDVWIYGFVENDRGEAGTILTRPDNH